MRHQETWTPAVSRRSALRAGAVGMLSLADLGRPFRLYSDEPVEGLLS